jgi:hypothetical protein
MNSRDRVIRDVAEAESDADLRRAQAQARAIIASDRAAELRKRAKRGPRIVREKATKAQRADNLWATRKAVLERTNNLCELCEGVRLQGVHLHHLYFGNGNRRKYEGPNACVLLCAAHHGEVHDNVPDVLQRLVDLAVRIGAPDIVQAALSRRLQKVTP